MKIFRINFTQNKQANTVKPQRYSALAPLAFDTVSFSGRPIKDIPYSIFQKEREVNAIRPVLQEATENFAPVSAEEISEKTGLDIYVVKLRLSTNSEIRELYGKLKTACSEKAEHEKSGKLGSIQSLLKILSTAGQKLTDNEIAFYLGLEKDESLSLVLEDDELAALYNSVLIKIKNCPPREKKKQISTINSALTYTPRKCTYDTLAQKTGLKPEIIRVRINEDDELFKQAISKKLYPPDIYPESEIEKQDEVLMNILLCALKHKKQLSISDISTSSSLYPGTILIRFKNNTALQETYDRIMGTDEPETDKK